MLLHDIVLACVVKEGEVSMSYLMKSKGEVLLTNLISEGEVLSQREQFDAV